MSEPKSNKPITDLDEIVLTPEEEAMFTPEYMEEAIESAMVAVRKAVASVKKTEDQKPVDH